MAKNSFWRGTLAGAAGLATGLGLGALIRPNRMAWLRRGVLIRRPTEEVFTACARLADLPLRVRTLVSVATMQDFSLWAAQIDGRRLEWDLEVVQVLPGRAIAWISHLGPRHSGRLLLLPHREGTRLVLEMNYEEPWLRRLRRHAPSLLAQGVENGLEELRVSLEQQPSRRSAAEQQRGWLRATGTEGAQP